MGIFFFKFCLTSNKKEVQWFDFSDWVKEKFNFHIILNELSRWIDCEEYLGINTKIRFMKYNLTLSTLWYIRCLFIENVENKKRPFCCHQHWSFSLFDFCCSLKAKGSSIEEAFYTYIPDFCRTLIFIGYTHI